MTCWSSKIDIGVGSAWPWLCGTVRLLEHGDKVVHKYRSGHNHGDSHMILVSVCQSNRVSERNSTSHFLTKERLVSSAFQL